MIEPGISSIANFQFSACALNGTNPRVAASTADFRVGNLNFMLVSSQRVSTGYGVGREQHIVFY